MQQSPEPGPLPEPANLRFLRRLVTTLTAVMILGLLVILSLLVIRLNTAPAPLTLPEAITLPGGARAAAVTLAPDHVVVLTEGQRVLVYDRGGELLREIALD